MDLVQLFPTAVASTLGGGRSSGSSFRHGGDQDEIGKIMVRSCTKEERVHHDYDNNGREERRNDDTSRLPGPSLSSLTKANSRSSEKLKSSRVKRTRLSKAAWTGPSGDGGWADARVKPNNSMLGFRFRTYVAESVFFGGVERVFFRVRRSMTAKPEK